MHEQEKQLQEQREAPNQWILNRVKWIIAQKNTLFILEHQNDTLEQLSAYLQTCMESIDHPRRRMVRKTKNFRDGVLSHRGNQTACFNNGY